MFVEGRAVTAQQKFLKKKVITLKHFNIVFFKNESSFYYLRYIVYDS